MDDDTEQAAWAHQSELEARQQAEQEPDAYLLWSEIEAQIAATAACEVE